MARNYQFKVAPLDIYSAGYGRVSQFNPEGKGVSGQSADKFQVTVCTPQTRKVKWIEVEDTADRDALIQAFKAGIASLEKMDKLPSPVVVQATTSQVVQQTATLPTNVLTVESLAPLLAAERRSTEKLLSDTMAELMAALRPAESKPATPPSPAPSGNGQAAAQRI